MIELILTRLDSVDVVLFADDHRIYRTYYEDNHLQWIDISLASDSISDWKFQNIQF